MRKCSMFMVAAAAIALLSCNKTPLSVEEEEITSTGSRTVVFTTEMFESKTSISGNKTDGYKSDWSVGDRIDVFENGKVYTSEPLEASDIVDGIAHFTVNFDEAESASVYRYIAVYPSHYYEEGGDDGPVLCSVKTKANDWSYDNFYYSQEEGYYFYLGIPYEQRPTSVSFDPNADLLISKEIIRENPVSEVESFQFARIGSMTKITLKGLDDYVGSKVENVWIEWDYETRIFGWVDYSSDAEKYVYTPGDSNPTILYPEDTYVKSDGTVDLWIRCFTGKEDTSMEIKLELENDGKFTKFARYIDLESMGKTLEFKEGHLAEFSVGGFLLDDVNFEQEAIVFRNTPDGTSVVFSWVANEFVKEYECYIDNYPEYIDLGLAQVNDGIASISVPRSSLPENSFFFNYEVTAIDGHYTPRYSGYKQMNCYPNLLDGGIDDNNDGMYSDNVKHFLGDIDLDFNTDYYYADGMHNEILGFRNVMMDYSNGFLCHASDIEPSSDGWKIWSVIPHKKMKGVKILMNDPDQATIESLHVYGASAPGGKDVELHISNIKTDYLTYIYFDFDESSDLSYYTITSDSSLMIWSLTGLYDF